MAKLQLIKLPSLGNMAIKDNWYLPIELLWIGTYIRKFGHEVEILDGQQLGVEDIKKQLCAPIVGLNFHIYSAECLDELVYAAKARGALVIVGGQAATPLAEQLLRGNEAIDAVVCYDGEEAMRQIADAYDHRQNPFANTPNVVHRSNGRIVRNSIEQVPVCKVSIPDRCLNGIDINEYIANFQTSNTFLGFDGHRATNAHTKKGCPRRCSFCGRMDKQHRARSPKQAFDEYCYLVKNFAVDYIFDHSDTWAIDPTWLEGFREVYEREGGLQARLSIFADLRDLTPNTIEDLKAVGVDTVETGIESGHEGILSQNRKRMRREQILERVTALTKAGIKVEASYVLGILGETFESVRETLDLPRRLRDLTNGRVRNYFNIIIPLPGTLVWERLMSDPAMQEKYGSSYIFDIEELRKDYLRRHCNLGYDAYEFLFEVRRAILAENGLPVMDYAR